MSTTQAPNPAHDPALTSASAPPGAAPSSISAAGPSSSASARPATTSTANGSIGATTSPSQAAAATADLITQLQHSPGVPLDVNSIMLLVRSLPGLGGMLGKIQDGNGTKDPSMSSAAETLSAMSQLAAQAHAQAQTIQSAQQQQQQQQQSQTPTSTSPSQPQSAPFPMPLSAPGVGIHPYAPTHHTLPQHLTEPGPSSHPSGPPMGHLGALAATAMGTNNGAPHLGGGMPPPAGGMPPRMEDEEDDEEGNGQQTQGTPQATGTPTRQRGRAANMGSDEWARQRKDNHKEVERRRRGNINEGINELGRIVPNGSGEKAKGAILSRAVQYIHHLKENEARNIEKWTLEKLLMDQAMGDLQAQLEEVRKMWDEERTARIKDMGELSMLREMLGKSQQGTVVEGEKRERAEDDAEKEKEGEEGADGEDGQARKRQRTE